MQKEHEYKVQTVTGTSEKHCVMVRQTACLGGVESVNLNILFVHDGCNLLHRCSEASKAL